ncbi:MAG: hypothetical protein IPP36_04260 [Nitrosomonadales bacterium]|nr:hypothetical protein [Nitrosomonadales bacterium]
MEGIIAIAAGDLHTVALKNDGTVWAWGHNSSGQLGIGTTTDSTIPVQVPGIAGVIRIAAAGGNTVALKMMARYGFGDTTPMGSLEMAPMSIH